MRHEGAQSLPWDASALRRPIPQLLRSSPKVSELVDGHSLGIKGEDVKRFSLQPAILINEKTAGDILDCEKYRSRNFP